MHCGPASPAPSAGDEIDLLSRLRRGDAAAFDELVGAHNARLLRAARRILGDEEDARDAVQETFVAALRSIHQFEGRARLATWLHRIAVNKSLESLRRRRSVFVRRAGAEPARELRIQASDPSEAPDALLDRRRRRDRIHRGLSQLGPRDREILLHQLAGRSPRETGRQLGIGEAAAKSRLHRARRSLRRVLEATP